MGESETEKSQINCLGTERYQDSSCNHLSHSFRISYLSYLFVSALNIYDSMYTLYTLLYVIILCRKCFCNIYDTCIGGGNIKDTFTGTYLYLKCFTTFKIPILEEIVGKAFKIWVSYIMTFKIYVS